MFFPIMVELEDKKVTIVGGGQVAYRKCKKLLAFGAKVTMVSPDVLNVFEQLKIHYGDNLNLIIDRYKQEYLHDSFLVIAATSSKNVNKTIVENSKELGVLVNSVDGKEDSDFITTSIISNDNLTISICTGGSFPALSKKIRKDMEEKYKKYDKEYMNLLEDIRYIIIEKYPEDKRAVMDKILDFDIDELRDYKNKLIDG